MTGLMEICLFCKGKFDKQGLPMHSRFCWTKPKKVVPSSGYLWPAPLHSEDRGGRGDVCVPCV